MGARRRTAVLKGLSPRVGPAPIEAVVQARGCENRLTILQGVERAATDSSADPALTLIDHDPSTNGHAEQRATGMSGASRCIRHPSRTAGRG
jgi:hypothetical protein